jgi:hypothetical protein
VTGSAALRSGPEGWLRGLPLLARAAAGTLVAFHAWLLLRRLADDSIGQPEVLLRWLGAAALAAGAVAMRRRGLRLLSGRSGLVFWLLVLLLHVGASPLPADGARAQEILSVLPLGLVAAWLAPVRVRPAVVASPPPQRPAATWGGSEPGSLHPFAPLGELACRFAPRPPPLRTAAL